MTKSFGLCRPKSASTDEGRLEGQAEAGAVPFFLSSQPSEFIVFSTLCRTGDKEQSLTGSTD